MVIDLGEKAWRRLLLGAEIAGVGMYTVLYLWFWRYEYPLLGVPIALAIVMSAIYRGHTLREMGIWPRNIFFGTPLTFALALPVAVAVMLIGGYVGAGSRLGTKEFLIHVAMYYPWALLQHVVLNGYFMGNAFAWTKTLPFRHPWRDAWMPMVVTAAAFCAIHWPNPTLTAITFTNSVLGAWLFMRYRNAYALAFAHAWIAVTVGAFLPWEWHHGLAVGPAFWKAVP